jgi:hypothetical protein
MPGLFALPDIALGDQAPHLVAGEVLLASECDSYPIPSCAVVRELEKNVGSPDLLGHPLPNDLLGGGCADLENGGEVHQAMHVPLM